MAKPNEIKRLEIPHIEGVNAYVASNVSKKQELGHALNARSTQIGTIEKRKGSQRYGNSQSSINENFDLFYFRDADSENATNSGVYKITRIGNTYIYYYNSSTLQWTILTGGSKSDAITSHTFAEGCAFITNGLDWNEYITDDGTTRIDSTDTTGHLYLAPKARLINYYKDKLYLGDYYYGSDRVKNGIMRSSVPLGIVALVDGDHDASETTIKITDVRYMRVVDNIEVYRGLTLVGTIGVIGKTDYEITIEPNSLELLSSDELWVAGTYANNDKQFRWTDQLGGGVDVKEYDTFKLAGGQNDELTMMENVGDVMVIANRTNMAYWNDYALQNLDIGVGVVSKNGFVKNLGSLFFLDYSGVYATTGEAPQIVSAKVEPYITGATKVGLESATAGKKGYSVFFCIGAVTLYRPDGSVSEELENVCIEYNVRQQNWFIHTGVNASNFTTIEDDSAIDRLLMATEDNGYHVHEFLVGTVDDEGTGSSYLNKEILFRTDTSNITLSDNFEQVCLPQEIIIETERGNAIECFVSLDNEPWYRVEGDIVKGCVILKVGRRNLQTETEPRCRRLRISIRDYTKNLCRISRIAIVYAITGDEENVREEPNG